RSIVTHEPVISEFATLFPATVELGVCAILFALCLGLPAGIIAAVRRNSVFDHGVMGISLTGYTMPIFWWGLLLILLFSVQLGLTPVSGRLAVQYFVEPVTGFLLIDTIIAGDWGAFRSALSHLVLPMIVLGTVPLAVIARMTRSAMPEVLETPATAAQSGAPPHPFAEFWTDFRQNAGALAGLVVIVALALLALFADVIAPHSPVLTNNQVFLKPPFWQEAGSFSYPLGT